MTPKTKDLIINILFFIIITALSYVLFLILESHAPNYNQYMGTLLTLP